MFCAFHDVARILECRVTVWQFVWEQKNGDQGGKDIMKKHRRQVLFSGIITAIGITTFSDPVLSLSNFNFICFQALFLSLTKPRDIRIQSSNSWKL